MNLITKCYMLLFIALVAMNVQAENRVALVIGNAKYASQPLTNPVHDAADIADRLTSVGFAVSKLENATRKQIKSALRTFSRQLVEKDSIGLFYYAGHGVQVKGNNYLIPVDADIQSEFEVEDEAIAVNRVLGAMEQAGNGLNLVILDACRDNPYASSFRSNTRGLAKVNAPKGAMVLYATSPGDVAGEGEGRNGIFTKHLLDAIEKPGLTVEQVFKETAIAVSKETAKQQVPWFEGVILGEFSFHTTVNILPEPLQSATKAATIEAQSSSEDLFWTSVKDTDDAEELEAFLQTYPESKFSALAKLRINKLKRPLSYSLTLRSNVYQDTVSIDGEVVGSTKLVIDLKPGKHQVKIEKEGYISFFRQLDLHENKIIRATLQVEPKQTVEKEAVMQPDEALSRVLLAIQEQKPTELWALLPDSYQADLNQLFAGFTQALDGRVYNKAYLLASDIVVLLEAKESFILSGPLLNNLPGDAPFSKQEIDHQWGNFLSLFKLILNGQLYPLEALREEPLGEIISVIGDDIAAILYDIHPLNVDFGKIELETLKRHADYALVNVTPTAEFCELIEESPCGDTFPLPMKLIEGKWLPEEVVSEWPNVVAEANAGIAELAEKQQSTDKTHVLKVLSMLQKET
jgi:uncharacterized caspase-like protein